MKLIYNGYTQDELDEQYNLGFPPYMDDGTTLRSMVGRKGPLRDSAMINFHFCKDCLVKLNPQTDIPYGEHEHPKRVFDFYRANSSNAPCVIVLSGGGYMRGRTKVWSQWSKKCIESGISLVDLDIPQIPDNTMSGMINDAENFIQWLSERADEYGIDPNKIILAGHSSGASIMATSLVRLANKKFASGILGAVLLSGNYDLLPVSLSFRQTISKYSEKNSSGLGKFHASKNSNSDGSNGGMRLTQEEILKCSATRNVIEPLPPIFVGCGDETDEMKYQQHKFAKEVGRRSDVDLIYFDQNHFGLGMELYEEDSKIWKFITNLLGDK